MTGTGTNEAKQFMNRENENEEVERAVLKSLLAALKMRDTETYDHAQRTVKISLLLGRACGLDYGEIRSLEFGALLHDIGKIGMPDNVLRKPGKLNDLEWAIMRRHPILGQEILRGLNFPAAVGTIVGQHHEKWDGSGYPLGLRGEEITLSARVLIVADAFDAMTSDRSYRPAKSYEEAVKELDACTGTHFDPRVVGAFHHFPRKDWERLARGGNLSALPDRTSAQRENKFSLVAR